MSKIWSKIWHYEVRIFGQLRVYNGTKVGDYPSWFLFLFGEERGKMKRFIYWIKKSIKNEKVCRGYCVTCKYYEICRDDRDM